MYLKLIKYFLVFTLLTLFSYAEGSIEKPSAEEEIKDTIVVHGMVLHGRVMNLGPKKLSFKLLYSEGQNHIAYKDIESINTKYNYHISFKRMDIEGRIVGIEDNKYLKIMEGDKERTVKIADIDNFVMAVSDDDSFENKIRNTFPYTKGNINIGFEIESSTSQKNEIDVLLNLRYKQAEHEIMLYVDYEYDTRKTEDTPDLVNKDELVGILSYKNHFKNNQFYFTTIAADYDRPRHILNRYIPSAGYGYRFRFDESKWLEPSIGLGYAATSYTDDIYADKNFAVAALNLSGKYQFDDVAYINRFIIDGFLMYYPSLTDMDKDWIFRSNLNFTVPLFDFFSVKLAYHFINDSNPNPSVGNNKTTTKLLFGFDF
jgi:putative salt-induced outer membrane protein YdiY